MNKHKKIREYEDRYVDNRINYEYIINGDIYRFVIDMNWKSSFNLDDIQVYSLNVDEWELADIVPGVDVDDGIKSFIELNFMEEV